MRLFLYFLVLLICPLEVLIGNELNKLNEKNREEESEKLEKLFSEYAKFYALPDDVDLLDITEVLLKSPFVKDSQKQTIQNFNRRIFVFIYPSDGLKIKGLISFVPDPQNHPSLVFLRGGNRIFGIQNPASDLMCLGQYTVISTTYRDGVSEGTDEFGGDDVNDVKNLMDFIPHLKNKLGVNFQNQKTFLLGGSRGGMQMFLALGRFPELQTRFTKIISLSGLLDMRDCIASRSDMEEMFISDFGLEKGVNEEEWINKRDPILTVNHISKQLPILIIQGTHDNRVSLQEGYNMVNKLQLTSHNVTYWEINNGEHCLSNLTNRTKLILDWLEE